MVETRAGNPQRRPVDLDAPAIRGIALGCLCYQCLLRPRKEAIPMPVRPVVSAACGVPWARGRRPPSLAVFLLPLLLYVAVQSGLCLKALPGLHFDEAEQEVWSQSLAWGYGVQPPLYTWLVWALFRVTGVSTVTLVALKATLLAGLIGLLYATARRWLRDARAAPLCAASSRRPLGRPL
jgi:hypothetical protein